MTMCRSEDADEPKRIEAERRETAAWRSMDPAMEPAVCAVAMDAARELQRARNLHGAMRSAHEGYAVILEELDELKAEVWKWRENRDLEHMREEAVQVAAMALRFALEVCSVAWAASEEEMREYLEFYKSVGVSQRPGEAQPGKR